MNSAPSIVLIHPPVAKPSEPPAGIARIVGALRSQGVACSVVDANIEALYYLLDQIQPPEDTWSRRAYQNLDRHLKGLRTPSTYQNFDKYQRAVADIGRLLTRVDCSTEIRLGLADYRDKRLSPVRSADLLQATLEPERNPYFGYYQNQLLPNIQQIEPAIIGISINYLSQALCAFALIGLLNATCPTAKIIIGGGLITSWIRRPDGLKILSNLFSSLVDQVVCGPGEIPLLKAVGRSPQTKSSLPDYNDFLDTRYLSPGFILPFSASDGCWWRRCAFCPERAEKRAFRPLPHKIATEQLNQLAVNTSPTLIHLLDNAISPALLKTMAAKPLNTPWYGFVRIGAPLDDLCFCYQLAASGCVMLKIGLESGSQHTLDRLEKGVELSMAARVLKNLKKAGIATYVYLLFGTPAEDSSRALKTLDFVNNHQATIGFLNLAIFNLPINSPDATDLKLHDFYDGDLALYRNFIHPKGWDRSSVRRFLSKTFKKHPVIQSIIRRDPPVFTSNHAPFFTDMYR